MNNPFLLSILIGLVVVRLVFLPLNDRIQVKSDEISALSTRFEKGERLIAQSQAIEEQLRKAHVHLAEVKGSFLSVPEPIAAQLSVQQQIQKLAKTHKLQVEEMEWVPIAPFEPEQGELKMSFRGSVRDFLEFQLSAVQMGAWIAIKQQSYRVENKVGKRFGDAKGSCEFIISYQVVEKT